MTDDIIEQAARVLAANWQNMYANESLGRQRMLADALADAGLLRQEPPTRDEIARAIRQATDDGASRTEDYADAVLALLEGRKR